jgi:DNA-binding response OmpR family regulator
VRMSRINKETLRNYPSLHIDPLLRLSSERFIEIIVQDNGRGISENELNNIFDPFYQVQGDGFIHVGTGIGLNLTKGIVELHYGTIFVESKESQGATFRVIIPIGPEHLKPDEITSDFKNSEDISHYALPDVLLDDSEMSENSEISRKKHSILVIEDNQDVRNYIKKHLWSTYTVYEATNGEEGMERAIKYMPDLVISDIMMPKVDGLQLCRKLKNDIHTSHIPIILLTARVTYQQVREGFEIGADEYITKPFNANNLLLRVKALIDNRERLRRLFEKKSPIESTYPEMPSMDDRFLRKVYDIVDANVSESDFNIEQFSTEIGMSRANLYRKIKALTNLSPNEFIKDIRLRIAVKYLRETSLSISEISYKTGFNSPAYFTNCFRKAFGVSPSEFLVKESESPSSVEEGS